MKYIKLFENFREQEINKATKEEQRIKDRVPVKNDKIRLGDRVYMGDKSFRCIESDGEGNTRIQQVINNGEDLGKIIILTDKQVEGAEPIGVQDSDGKYTGWKVKYETH